MPEISRTEKVKAERKKKREEGLIIFRYAADLFRFVDDQRPHTFDFSHELGRFF